MRWLCRTVALTVILWPALSAPLPADEAQDAKENATRRVDFVADVQPILRRSCFSCHGAEDEQSGLRLDVKARALEGGDYGKAIVPGDSAASRLIRVVSGADDELGIMPPEGEGTPLTDDQIAVLRRWIDEGADWPADADAAITASDHWSFQPITRPALPDVNQRDWIASPIDAFVLARLEREGIQPAPLADRATQIRRVYLDLLGLPPTPGEVNAYVGDDQPGAYERMIDRAFASPHYGERWGRHWLDLARYADSDGYEKDRPRPHAWRYREWVIRALNADMPFDRFSRDQLAGDILPDAGLEAKVASGFHRNTLHNTEGGIDPEEDRVKKTVDRTNTVGSVWMGLTVGCAQCHSHKYDPLTQREYYQLYAFFNNLDEVDVDAPLPLDQQRYASAKAEFDAAHALRKQAVADYAASEEFAAALAQWEQSAAENALVWQAIEPTSAVSKHGAELKRQDDLSLLPTGKNEVSDVYTVETRLPVDQPLTAIRLEVLPDDSLVKKGPGRADNGNFVLTTFRVLAKPADGEGAPIEVSLHNAQADFSQNNWQVAKAINDNPADGWAVGPQFGQRHVAVFELQQPVAFPSGTQLTVVLDQNYTEGGTHNLGRFRLSVTSGQPPATLEGLPAEVAAALAVERSERSDEQQKQVVDYFKTRDAEYQRLEAAVAKHAQQAPQPPGVKAQTVAQRKAQRQTTILVRGDFLNPGDPVDAATPAVLPPLPGADAEAPADTPDRLDLVAWLFNDDNPLTARVTVNRLWQRFFGRGIVATVDDFGSQGAPPSHPELLDWLADEFRSHGYSLKYLQRLIVSSNTYRQSSAFRPELEAIDPDNALLARQKRRRVEAEVIRDLALDVSGLLDNRVGGPSVRPPQPAEYSNLTYANSAKWSVSAGGDAYRRGLYTFFQRTSPYPMFMTFDSPDSTECCTQRSESNTPLQALTLWNDGVFFECAQQFGRRVLRDGPSSGGPALGSPTADRLSDEMLRQQAEFAFQLCLARKPTPEELRDVIALFQDQRDLARANPEAATAIIGEQSAPGDAEPAELAAWIVVGRTLMNLDEFITRE